MPENLLRLAALQYAAAGWHVVPLHWVVEGCCSCRKGADCASPGKHTLVKWRDMPKPGPDAITAWWTRWPHANVGILTGLRSGIGVLDIDGAAGAARLKQLVEVVGVLLHTLMAESGRVGGGRHAYYAVSEKTRNATAGGLDWRGDGGLVVAPPSRHKSGATYKWIEGPLAALPPGLMEWFSQQRKGVMQNRSRSAQEPADNAQPPAYGPGAVTLPAHLQGRFNRDVVGAARIAVPLADIDAALAAIPNPDLGWEEWNTVLMAVWASGGTLEQAQAWSAKSRKHNADVLAARWAGYTGSPPASLTFGKLVWLAQQAEPGWIPPSQWTAQTPVNGHLFHDEGKPINPLERLNKEYAFIANIGNKCIITTNRKILSFQSAKNFSERFANEFMLSGRGKPEPLGAKWLKWPGRKTYEGIDLDPDNQLPGNIFNLWQGWGVAPKAGAWPLMGRHIHDVLAQRDIESARYILRWAAWTVQNPGVPAEVALVFRGDKGVGKGIFARTVKQMFGPHGLQVNSRSHFVGHFNAHLRNCLLLYSDEAFWAGDKQAEGILKGMLTEPTLPIEQKGVDVMECANRLHVIMTTNSDWVVPASHDERRYAVFECAEKPGEGGYFKALQKEIREGGAGAMLHDLRGLDLGEWHPREIVHTDALRGQIVKTMGPLEEWWFGVVSSGALPVQPTPGNYDFMQSSSLYETVRAALRGHRPYSDVRLWEFFEGVKATKTRKSGGIFVKFPKLSEARARYEKRLKGQKWGDDLQDWTNTAIK